MTDWKVYDVVEILVKDDALLDAKTQFARFLNIPGVSLKEFEDDYNQHKKLRSYFCDVLGKWKSFNGNKATILSLANILRENEFAASADRLTHFHNNISVPVTVFGVKGPVFNFVGRQNELKELNELFNEKKSSVVLSSAMGGKGKTELCRRFIQQLPKGSHSLVTWLSGDGQQQFLQSLSEFCQEKNVQTTDSTGKPLSVEKIIENISINKKSKWVVIIDNVDAVFQDFYSAIDAFLRNGAFVVVTSRKSDIQTEKHIFLKDLEDEDALEFVKLSLNKPSQENAVELCKCLQNYPLALQQAVAYIKYKQQVKDDNYANKEYLIELNLDNSEVFDHKIPLTGYDLTIVKVFELTLDKILSVPGHNALYLLHILSLVQPDGIEQEFFKKLFSFFPLEELFDSSISILKTFSLIGVNKGEVSVHRIVQKLTRNKIKKENKFDFVINKIIENIDIDKLTKKSIVQVIQIWKNALQESEIIKKNSNFAEKMSRRLFNLSLYREMKDFSEITLQQFVTSLGPEHFDTLRMQGQLGRALDYNGEYDESLINLKVIYERGKKIVGEEHEEVLDCASEIALVLYRLKRFDESLEWHEKVLKFKIKIHGENHKSSMITKNNMAVVLDDQGKREEALTIHRQVLEWREKELGHEHPDTLMTRHNTAACLYYQWKFVEAKKEFEEVLEFKVKILGEEHADTLHTKAWLSITLHSLGQKEKGIEMMEQVLISRVKVLGSNHPDTNNTRDKISEWKNLSMYQTIKNKCILY